jgi:ATP-dependent Clp protease protease subunit
MKEDLDRIREMSARLVGEVASKIGLESEDDFVKQMYENRSSGDWDLFADQAVEQGWVDHVVHEIREASVRKRPTGSRNSGLVIIGLHKAPANEGDRYEVTLTEETDEKGRSFVRLPRLDPVDAWFLYNPDGYYR